MKSKLLLPVLFGALVVVNIFALHHWVAQDTRPAAWDQSIHIKNAFEYRDRIANEGFSSILKPAYFNYPPLYHLAMVPFLTDVRDIADVGARANIYFLVILLACIFLIGKDLVGPWHGLTAAFLFSAYPLAFDMATQSMIDLSLAAWVTLTFWCLIRSEKFSHWSWSVLCGLSLGLGMLTKWTAVWYLFGPLVLAAWGAYRAQNVRKVVVAIAVTTALILPWYLTNFFVLLVRLPKLAAMSPASGYALPGWMNMFWYPLSLFEQINLVFVLFLIPGLIVFFWRPRLGEIMLWFFGSLLLFSLISNHNTRYFLPALPAAAVLSVSWLPTTRRVPIILMNVVIALYFLTFHAFPERTFFLRAEPFPIPVIGWHAPVRQDWKHNEIITKIDSLIPEKGKIAHVLTISNGPHFHSTTLDLSLKARGMSNLTFRGPAKRRMFEFADFVLLKTGSLGPEGSIRLHKECADLIAQNPLWFQNTFQEAARWPLPDGSEAILYEQSPKPFPIINIGLINLSLDQLVFPNAIAEAVELRAVPIGKKETEKGHLRQLTLSARKLSYKGVPFDDVRIELMNPIVNIPLFLETQDLQLLKLNTLRPEASLDVQNLIVIVKEKAKWLKDPVLTFQGDMLTVSGRAGVVPFLISMKIQVNGPVLETVLGKIQVAGVPLPRFLFRALTNKNFSLLANDEMAYNLDIKSIRGENGLLRIN